MKGYVIYNKEADKYVDILKPKEGEYHLTDWVGNVIIFNERNRAEIILNTFSHPDEFEIHCLTDEDKNDEGKKSSCDFMTLEELPKLAEDLKRWGATVLVCGIMEIMRGNFNARESKRIKEEAEKIEEVGLFIEHVLTKRK